MQEHGLRPRARDEGLVVQELGDESLVYDRKTEIAHCLGAVAARVWRGCDGERDVRALASFAHVPEELVADALEELQLNGLLADEAPSSVDTVAGVSRRDALRRIAVTGLAASSVPLIVSAAAGTPLALASAGSTCATCTTPGTQDNCGPGSVCAPQKVCIPTGFHFVDQCPPTVGSGGTCSVPASCMNVSCGHLCM